MKQLASFRNKVKQFLERLEARESDCDAVVFNNWFHRKLRAQRHSLADTGELVVSSC
jgi:hypothetical protein